jgi:hypothetical protein
MPMTTKRGKPKRANCPGLNSITNSGRCFDVGARPTMPVVRGHAIPQCGLCLAFPRLPLVTRGLLNGLPAIGYYCDVAERRQVIPVLKKLFEPCCGAK